MATVQERTGRTLAQPVPTSAPGTAPQRPPARQPWRRRLLLVVLLTGCSVLFLVPFVWLISASLRPGPMCSTPRCCRCRSTRRTT